MAAVSQKSWTGFSNAAVSGGMSFLVTFMTIVGFGWKMHREIMSDVAAIQAQSNKVLEQTLVQQIGYKLDREPSNFQLTSQAKELSELKVSVQNSNQRMEDLDRSIQELKSILNRKEPK